MALSKEEQAELAQLESQGFSADEDAELAALEAELETPSQKLKRYGMNTLKGGVKVLDYLRGATTAPILAGVLEAKTGKDVFRGDEYLKALNPWSVESYPGAGELMERAGVPEGAKVSDYFPSAKDRFYDASLRGAGGVGVDIAIDPLTYLSFGTSAALKQGAKGVGASASKNVATRLAEAATAPVRRLPSLAKGASEGLQGLGRRIYESGLVPIEQAADKAGKREVAETMYRRGIRGNATEVEERIAQEAGKLKNERDAILKTADDAGALVDRGEAFSDFANSLDQMVVDRRITREEADKILEDTIGVYLQGGKPDTRLATQWKSDLSNSLPAKAYEKTKNISIAQQMDKQAAGGLKRAIEKAIDRASGAEAAQQLAAKNSELGNLLTVRKASERMADVAERKPTFTAVDAMLGGGMTVATDPGKAAAVLGAKKLLELGRLTSTRTNLGYGLRKLGENELTGPMIDILTRRAAVGATRKKGNKDGEEK